MSEKQIGLSNGNFSQRSFPVSCLRLFSLRTRMASVQTSEEMLDEKKAHCMAFLSLSLNAALLTLLTDSKVVNAFNSAMALLGNI